MFRPLPINTIGYVTEAASRISTTLAVDSVLWSKIAAELFVTDWTYLQILSCGKTEVIKVTEVLTDRKIKVIRGMEGTAREAVLVNSPIEYELTLSGLYDQVRAMVSPITLTATGECKVNPIYSPIVDIDSNAALEIVSDGHIFPGNYKTCEPYICAGYVLGPYYLTSVIYPIEVVERMYSTAKWGHSRLLTDPQDTIVTQASWVSSSLRALLQKYDNGHNDIQSTASWLSGEIRTLLKSYNITGAGSGAEQANNQITSTAQWLSGNIRTLLIKYTNWPYESITSTASWRSGVLT